MMLTPSSGLTCTSTGLPRDSWEAVLPSCIAETAVVDTTPASLELSPICSLFAPTPYSVRAQADESTNSFRLEAPRISKWNQVFHRGGSFHAWEGILIGRCPYGIPSRFRIQLRQHQPQRPVLATCREPNPRRFLPEMAGLTP